MTGKLDYYTILGLTKEATPEEVRHAYREAARRLHPDVNNDPEASQLYLQIQEAYKVLSDPEKRENYDLKLAVERKDPVDINILYSRSAISIVDEPQLIYALINFSTPQNVLGTPSPPINLCLILDRSTSMQGERMDTIKMAAIELVRQLRPEDMLTIITFNDRAEVLVPATQRQDRKSIESQIQMIHAGGGTEIFQGLDLGFSEVSRNANRSSINHIILLTDGRTYGDEDTCLQLAEKAALHGIRITGLGIGTDWNDVFMDELATRSGGSSHYIHRTKDIHTFLQEKFSELKQIYAERVVLNIETDENATLSAAYRLQPDVAILPSDSQLRLGSIVKTTDLSVLLEFTIGQLPSNVHRILLLSGELNLLLVHDPMRIQSVPLTLSRLVVDSLEMEFPPRPIFQALSQINLYRMQERARQEVAEGKVQEATQRLQRLATQLLSLGEKSLAEIALLEADRIEKTNLLSPEGEKQIKYGTRKLLLPAVSKRKEA